MKVQRVPIDSLRPDRAKARKRNAKDLNAIERLADEIFEVVIECNDEAEQKELYERLTAEGHSCKLFTL